MKSISHNSVYTGILDMNGNHIFNGSRVKIHDSPIYKKNEGIVIWKQGNYQIEGAAFNYNVYAWRKSIEVLILKGKPKFVNPTMEELWTKFSASLSIIEPNRSEIKRAFKYAYESAIENTN